MLTLSDKVVVKTSSGLGNQLFQLANGLEQASRLSAPLLCDRSENDGVSDRNYALGPLESLCGFESTLGLHQALDFSDLKDYQEKIEFRFDPDINNITLGTRISGYFQHPDYSIKSIPILLRALASLKFQEPDMNSIHLHVRRGDISKNRYLRKKFGILDIQYYIDAIDFLGLGKTKSVKLKIFSDSPQDVLKLFKNVFSDKEVVLGRVHSDPLSNLLELSNASILVGANSTFSWWAGKLMESINPDVKVVFPRGLLRNILDSRVLVQSNWSSIQPTWK